MEQINNLEKSMISNVEISEQSKLSKFLKSFFTWGLPLMIFSGLVITYGVFALMPAPIPALGINQTSSVTDEGIKNFGAAIGAGIACIGMLGTGIGQGIAAGKSAEGVSRNPEAAAKIQSQMIIGSAIAESSALYCFVIAIMLIFVF